MVIVVMGVAGSGKSAVGRLLAETWNCPFLDADDLHPAANVRKMTAGEPLADEDRQPWLAAIRGWIRANAPRGARAVVACSALKERYRRSLAGDRTVRFVFLDPSTETLRKRLRDRRGHFMKEGMLESQLEALEPPADALRISGDEEEPSAIVRRIVRCWPDR